MNKPNCILCNSSDYKIKFKKSRQTTCVNQDGFSVLDDKTHNDIVQCQQCGLFYVYPFEDYSYFQNIYRNLDIKNYVLEAENRAKIFFENAKLIQQYISMGTLLDLGCSVGLLLDAARKLAFSVIGVELSVECCKYAKNILNLNIVNSALESIEFKKNSVDIITMIDVIEHLQDPVSVLIKCWTWLNQDGYLVLNTPNINSLSAKLLGQKWYGFSRSHLYYFDKETIESLLCKCNYTIISNYTYPRIFSLEYILRKLNLSNIFINAILKYIPNSIIKKSIRIDLKDSMLIIAKKKYTN